MTTRERFVATYYYPGVFFPEETSRELVKPTFQQALAAAPDEEGYFRKDGWYGLRITSIIEKKFVADDDAVTWVRESSVQTSWIIGERIHRDDERLSDPSFDSMKLGGEEYFVLARCGNWQPDGYYEFVVTPEELKTQYQVTASS